MNKEQLKMVVTLPLTWLHDKLAELAIGWSVFIVKVQDLGNRI